MGIAVALVTADKTRSQPAIPLADSASVELGRARQRTFDGQGVSSNPPLCSARLSPWRLDVDRIDCATAWLGIDFATARTASNSTPRTRRW